MDQAHMAADDLTPGADSPRPAPGFEGVLIAVSIPSPARGPVDLLGTFQLSAAAAVAFGAQPHRGLALVVTSGDGGFVGSPYRERLFFKDDVERPGGMIRGFFRYRLVGPDQSIPSGLHWVSVSLGPWLSNVVEIAGALPAGGAVRGRGGRR